MLVSMTLLALSFPNFDPVAFAIGPISVKWYGLSYMAGLLIGWWYVRKLLQTPRIWAGGQAPFDASRVDDLLIYMTLGVIIGGRLGSVLFYEPGHYFSFTQFDVGGWKAGLPAGLIFETIDVWGWKFSVPEVLETWKGGMAFHGALLGCGAAIALFARRNGVPVLSTMDLCAAAVPIGLMFGRFANFINGELFGRPTSMPWGMVFPRVADTYPQFADIEPAPRHPSQLYESLSEGLLLFLALRVVTHSLGGLKRPGLATGVFLFGYAIARSTCEMFRQPDPAHAFTIGWLTPGIAYSIPMAILGVYFWHLSRTPGGAAPSQA